MGIFLVELLPKCIVPVFLFKDEYNVGNDEWLRDMFSMCVVILKCKLNIKEIIWMFTTHNYMQLCLTKIMQKV